MVVTLKWNGMSYSAELNKPLHVAIPLRNGVENQPNAFGAPPFEASPLRAGDFTGSVDAGAPVNFFNVRVNPHGNGTHTETVGHITAGESAIHEKLKVTHCVAEVVSVYPTQQTNGDRVITAEALDRLTSFHTDGLIVRTLPNKTDKMTHKYTGTNPPYFSEQAMHWICDRRYQHLLTDLPSVDREQDGGALVSHKIFWGLPENKFDRRTITEMIYVDNDVDDGLYLLDLQIAPLILDASPSRPVLYKLNPVE